MEKQDLIKNNIMQWVKKNLGANFVFRPHQLETIINIVSNILNSAETNQIIEAPTGSGKSVIILVSAGVLSEYYHRRSYILCSDLSLWKQYYDFIKKYKLDFGYLKGQLNNYYCRANNNSIRSGDCRINGKSWSYLMSKQNSDFECAKGCPYIKDRKRACVSSSTLLTYQCFMYTLMHQDYEDNDSKNLFNLTPRDIIFCDECHHMSDVVMTQFTPHIYASDIDLADKVYTDLSEEGVTLPQTPVEFQSTLLDLYEKLKDTKLTPKENLDLVNKFYTQYHILWNAVKERQEYYVDIYKKLSDSEKVRVSKLYRTFETIIVYGDQFRDLLRYLESEKFLIKELNGTQLTFYNLKQDFLVYKCLLSKAAHRVMLSATVGDVEVFKDSIGIKYLDKTDVYFDRIPSIFDFSKSPITIYTQYKLNYYNKQTLYPKIKQLTYELCEKFPNQRGLIQTTSYADALEIYKSAPEKLKHRLSIYSNSSEKDGVLEKHKSKKDNILLGPTLNEGLDLPDDLCRFIIVTKIPYPQLNNEFTRKKLELFSGWYENATSLKLIQTIGRGVRNEKDYCETFILDSNFFDIFEKTSSQYPEELVNRFLIET